MGDHRYGVDEAFAVELSFPKNIVLLMEGRRREEGSWRSAYSHNKAFGFFPRTFVERSRLPPTPGDIPISFHFPGFGRRKEMRHCWVPLLT